MIIDVVHVVILKVHKIQDVYLCTRKHIIKHI